MPQYTGLKPNKEIKISLNKAIERHVKECKQGIRNVKFLLDRVFVKADDGKT